MLDVFALYFRFKKRGGEKLNQEKQIVSWGGGGGVECIVSFLVKFLKVKFLCMNVVIWA